MRWHLKTLISKDFELDFTLNKKILVRHKTHNIQSIS